MQNYFLPLSRQEKSDSRRAIAAFIFLGLHIFGAVAYLNKTPELARIGLGMFFLQALFLTIALLVYRDRVVENGNEQAQAEVDWN